MNMKEVLIYLGCGVMCCTYAHRAEAEKPASRKIAPESRKAAPETRKAPETKKTTKPATTTAQVTRFRFKMYFNGKACGKYPRREVKQPSGQTTVHNNTNFSFKYWFWTVKGVNKSTLHYTKTGMLKKFKVYSKVRGKLSEVWGTQNAKGITISVKKGGRTKKKFFSKKQYDSTSLDLRFKIKPVGKKYTRRQLNIPKQTILKQSYTYSKDKPQKWFGKTWDVYKVEFVSKRGKAWLWFSNGGWIVGTKFKIPVGKMSMKLKRATRS